MADGGLEERLRDSSTSCQRGNVETNDGPDGLERRAVAETLDGAADLESELAELRRFLSVC